MKANKCLHCSEYPTIIEENYNFSIKCSCGIETKMFKTKEELISVWNNSDIKHNYASCLLSILDSLKLFDNDSLYTEDETLSEIMFRKMKAYDIDLNKDLGMTHLKPVKK